MMLTYDDCARGLRMALDANAPAILGCLDMREAMAEHIHDQVPENNQALAEILLSSPSLGQEADAMDTATTAMEAISEAITARLFEEGCNWIGSQLYRLQDDVARVCNEAAELIRLGGHNKGHTARDGDGKPVCTMDPEARAWCIAAAIHRAANTLDLAPDANPGEIALTARNAVAKEIEQRYPQTSDQACRAELTAEPLPSTWNDLEAVTQGMVVVVLRGAHRARILRALEAEKAEEAA